VAKDDVSAPIWSSTGNDRLDEPAEQAVLPASVNRHRDVVMASVCSIVAFEMLIERLLE